MHKHRFRGAYFIAKSLSRWLHFFPTAAPRITNVFRVQFSLERGVGVQALRVTIQSKPTIIRWRPRQYEPSSSGSRGSTKWKASVVCVTFTSCSAQTDAQQQADIGESGWERLAVPPWRTCKKRRSYACLSPWFKLSGKSKYASNPCVNLRLNPLRHGHV